MALRFLTLSTIAVFCGLLIAGCAGSNPNVVARVGDDVLTLEDFEEQYAKNNGGWEKSVASTPEDRERFLDLLVRFKLKVKQAYDRGLLADSAVKSELEGYEVTVATAYMIDKEIVEPKVREMYDRKQQEVRASHILFRVDQSASPQDTLTAYNKALKVLGMLSKYSFDTLAVSYSEDQSVSFNKGDLGFFSAGRMVPEFEDVAYRLNVGEVTPVPIRTQFGYHIIKVTGRQANRGAVRVSHLLRRFHEDMSDSAAVTDSTWIIYRMLKGGADFAETAKRYSQDAGSAPNGGDIGFYDRERVPPNVAEIFFSAPLGSVTEPLRMPYGYHIFKITGYSEQAKFQDAEKDLRQQYQQTRYNADYTRYAKALLAKYQWMIDTLTIEEFCRSLDSTKTASSATWADTLAPSLRSKILFTVQNRPSTVNNLIDHVNSTSEFRGMMLTPKNVHYMIERLTEGKMVEEHAREVPKRYPAFSRLLKEYQDGILLYRIEQDEVWKKVVVNDSLLEAFHDSTKENYRWPYRVNFAEIYTSYDTVAAKAAYKEIQAGKDFGEVAEKYTMRAGYKEKKGVWGWLPTIANEFSRYAAVIPVDSIRPPFEHSSGWSIIKVLGKDSAHAKSFEEAKPEVMSAYQEHASKVRQEEWISELKKQYPVVLNKELLMQAFRKKQGVAQ
jgi:peptidyl-prolyl cis-trans isomerase SurA